MRHLITFVTDKLDPSAEPPNESNPIPGKSLLDWLRAAALADGYETTEPDFEDWGWYMFADSGTDKYMVGGTCFNDYEEPPQPGEFEWLIQISKERSVVDWFLRRNKLEEDDALTEIIFSAIEAEEAFKEVRREHEDP